ncbi:MAG: 3-hydroxyacyl-CoA dehydrogenase [Desulfarculus sp.]|nr:MAG: 3-hydroxyacyl-CoA dehydrogenase [Desulfarculus sp.]
MQIKDSVAIITGGASGLGEATARHLLQRGGQVALFDLAGERGQALAQDLGERVIFCQVDVTDEAQVDQGVRRTVEAFGSVQVAVNCAGIGVPFKVLGKDGPMDMGRWIKTLQINLVGTMQVIRLAAQRMAANQPNAEGERGVVINTASIAAFEGQVGQSAYAASKAGVVGLTLPLAREFASLGIRVLTIAPGLFQTPMMASLPEKVQQSLGQSVPFPSRLGRPQEFALLAEQIIANPMLNGETIRLDGALRMAPR